MKSEKLKFISGKPVWFQKEIKVAKGRGCHIITEEIVKGLRPEISKIIVGTLHLFIKHTSAGISINESYDPDVMKDLANSLDRLVPEDSTLYLHTDEGEDDAPSHIKCSLFGTSLTIPITKGELALGTWQGIILGEFRNEKKTRSILATINGCIEENNLD